MNTKHWALHCYPGFIAELGEASRLLPVLQVSHLCLQLLLLLLGNIQLQEYMLQPWRRQLLLLQAFLQGPKQKQEI